MGIEAVAQISVGFSQREPFHLFAGFEILPKLSTSVERVLVHGVGLGLVAVLLVADPQKVYVPGAMAACGRVARFGLQPQFGQRQPFLVPFTGLLEALRAT